MMKVCLASAKVKTLLQGFWLFDPSILDGIIITAQESYAYNSPGGHGVSAALSAVQVEGQVQA
jgi:hypothetical protein